MPLESAHKKTRSDMEETDANRADEPRSRGSEEDIEVEATGQTVKNSRAKESDSGDEGQGGAPCTERGYASMRLALGRRCKTRARRDEQPES